MLRLKTALKTENETKENEVAEDIAAGGDDKIVTTEEEMEAFYIVKAILRAEIPSERICYRDAQNYFTVILDDNNRRLVCRLYLNSPTNKQITFVGEDKKEEKHKIASIDEIYNYADKIISAANKFQNI